MGSFSQMKTVLLIGVLCLINVPSSIPFDLVVGRTYNEKIIWQQKVQYVAIPFKKRVKEIFYASPAQQVIKGVVARDVAHTDAKASITAGGIGQTFVNIKLKSERGDGLNYLVEIY